MSSETTAGDAAGNYVIVRTFTADDWKQLFGYQTITVGHHSAGVHLRPADYTVECWNEPMEDATASDNCGGRHRSVERDHRWRCRRQLRDRSHLHCNRRRWKQLFGYPNITVGTHSAGVHLRHRLHRRCSDECMDDATAWSNCGEVTIEYSTKPPLAMPPATS